MENIVSPWLIYMLFKIDTFATFLTTAIPIFAVIATFLWLPISDEGWETKERYMKFYKKFVPVCIFLFVLGGLTPSKNALIAMYVANEVTYDRAEKVIDVTKDVKNSLKKDIIDIIQEVTKGGNNGKSSFNSTD